jgi:tRNA(Arg) A34 adenosine deaminase TadA
MECSEQEYFMREALREAELGLEQGFLPVGAVIVHNRIVIAKNHNQVSTKKGLLYHAELLVLQQVDNMDPKPGKRKDMALFTTLEPCMKCLGAVANLHLGSLYYGLETEEDGFVKTAQRWESERKKASRSLFGLPKVIVSGICRKESAALFAAYVRNYSKSPFVKWAKYLSEL